LGQIVSNEGEHLLNFASVIAKDANNIVNLGGNVRVSISIVDGGIRLARIGERQKADRSQLEFGFIKPEDSSSGD
jgi:hypothetical protein